MEALVQAGLVIPLSSATSPIVRAMRDGSMPPQSSGSPLPTEADINVVSEYIDIPLFWPGVAPPAPVDNGTTVSIDAGTPVPPGEGTTAPGVDAVDAGDGGDAVDAGG